MNLTDLNRRSTPFQYKDRKRRGRGEASGLGKTSGRGTKGAAARAGYKRRPGWDGGALPFFRRFPKRGFNNVFRTEYDIVNLAALDALEGIDRVDLELLAARGIVRKRHGRLKVLGSGKLTRKLSVTAAKFSAAARRQIEALGGEAKEI